MARVPPVAPGRLPRSFESMRSVLLSPLSISIFTAACLGAAAVRRSTGVEPAYPFIAKNLLLAWIPLVLAYALAWIARRRSAWFAIPTFGVAWLVFLPNAPYLATDVVHVRDAPNVPNAITLAILAATGVLIAVKAVQVVEHTIERYLNRATARFALRWVAALTAFGVYLGRIQRWNSWTLIAEPQEFGRAISAAPSHLGRVAVALLATLLLALAFSLVYRAFAGAGADVASLASERSLPAMRS